MSRLVGALVVRNAADIVRVTVLHHLALGLDAVLVTDNGSTDGTRETLGASRRNGPSRSAIAPAPTTSSRSWTSSSTTRAEDGADWVVPFDADEFLVCPRGLRDRPGRDRAPRRSRSPS